MTTPEVFVDTSALYAFLVAEDANHPAARAIMASASAADLTLVSSSCVIQEGVALLQSRVGVPAVRTLRDAVLPSVEVVFIDESLLQRALDSLLAAAQRRTSLTDWSSFTIMRERGIDTAFAFDDDFSKQGFRLLRAA